MEEHRQVNKRSAFQEGYPLVPVESHQLHEFETVLSRCMGKELADLGELQSA